MTRLPVLMYHAVQSVSGRLRNLGVPPRLLAAQLHRLRAEGYRLVGLTEALRMTHDSPRPRVVALTFDDAYADFLTAAVPVLTELEARATLYVPTGHVGGPASWLGSDGAALPRLLTWLELRECVAARVEIGSHSITHPQLDTLPLLALEHEVRDSRRRLQEALGVSVESFCYPHGYHSALVRSVVRSAGYDNACEVGRRLRSERHRHAISRLAVGPAHTAERLSNEVRNGGPLVVPVVKRALQPAWRQVRRRTRAGRRSGST